MSEYQTNLRRYSDPGTELKRRFTQRVSRFFSYRGENPKSASKNIGDADNIRSKFVPGVFSGRQLPEERAS